MLLSKKSSAGVTVTYTREVAFAESGGGDGYRRLFGCDKHVVIHLEFDGFEHEQVFVCGFVDGRLVALDQRIQGDAIGIRSNA